MQVIKRDGRTEPVQFDKISKRIEPLCEGLCPKYVDPIPITQKVVEGFYNLIKTSEIDILAAETCAYMSQRHPHYSILAARIAVSNLHRSTSDSFYDTCKALVEYTDRQGRRASLLAQDVWEFVEKHKAELEDAIQYERDFGFDFFGFKTLEKTYLLKVDGKVIERPQHMFMRVACGIHAPDVAAAVETYNLMSQRFFTHATPTLMNAGTLSAQMSSCFLLTMQSDSIIGIYNTLKQCALISRLAGGIGLAISNVRSKDSYIRSTNGYSNGIVPMLRVFNETARYVDQGGRRKGSFAIYLEPWHADILDFIELRKNHGKEEQRARDLFYALWIPDLFMERVRSGDQWTLFCPDEARDDKTGKRLMNVWGTEFEDMYHRLEAKGVGRKQMKAQELWARIMDAQMETGTPFMLYKDACNRKSNQQNLGTINCSNLCTEVVQYTDKDEVAVCNLASVALPAFVRKESGEYDFEELRKVIKVMTRNLNKVIDRNHYPLQEAKRSNCRHRPIGLGVQGLADAFIMLRLPFESNEARKLNEDIFETIYFAACEASCELAEVHGAYETYKGSPASQGMLQFDLWKRTPRSDRWDWAGLKERIGRHGLRNSLLVAPMPTASTAQILGNNESIEPYTQNIYVRRVLAGEFVQVNRHLLHDLIERGLWNENLREQLIAHNGSVQNMDSIPADLKQLYKTVWEIKQRCVVDMAADRGAYIDQSQSLNIHMVAANQTKLSSMHFHGWSLGLKTGMYYLRTKAAADPIKFTVEAGKAQQAAAPQQGASATPPEDHQEPKGEAAGPSSATPLSVEEAAIQQLKAASGKQEVCLTCSA